jgi:hypothetical protein
MTLGNKRAHAVCEILMEKSAISQPRLLQAVYKTARARSRKFCSLISRKRQNKHKTPQSSARDSNEEEYNMPTL